MTENRPLGRQEHVTGGGAGVHRRGSGLGTGPVGSSNGYGGRGSGGSGGGSGPLRSGGGGGCLTPLVIAIALIVLAVTGGKGLFSGTTGTGSADSGSYDTGTDSSGSYNSVSGSNETEPSGDGTMQAGSASDGFGQLSSLFGSDYTDTLSGTSSSWSGTADNRGTLNTDVAQGARAKYTKLKGSGKDTVTVMVYMCGTDLESKSGMATSDISEMANATLSDNVNVILYTGGCTQWQNDVVSSRTNQIYRVADGGLQRLVKSVGDKVMTDPATLTSFINYCTKNFPADRNELVLWDHGGGSISGYGYDEKHSDEGAMSLSGIKAAVVDSGQKFDFIGFDACLMATAENALSLSGSADYLIASEETEPGMGWYYTNWLTELSKNTSVPTTTLAKTIIDDFVDVSAQKCRGQSTTLSLIDLAELQKTFPSGFSTFSKETAQLISGNSYSTVSAARSGAREFASSSKIDQVDLVDLAGRLGTDSAKALTASVLSAVKYNRTSDDMTNAYGLSIYFPYKRLSYVDTMISSYKTLGLDTDYSKCISSFAKIEASGQYASGGSSSPFGVLTGGSSYGTSSYDSGSYDGSSYGSYSTDALGELLNAFLGGDVNGVSGLTSSNTGFLSDRSVSNETIVQSIASSQFDPSALVWTSDGGRHLLHLSEEQWEKVRKLDLNVFYDDGSGYVDLGLDNNYSFSDSGDLIGDTDGTWLSINSQPVAYYHLDTVGTADSYTITGRVPAMLNGTRVNLILVFDNDHPYGYIAGARTDYVNGETDTLAKSMTGLQAGDKLDFLCDYYTYSGTYQDSYYLGEEMTVDDPADIEISNTKITGDGGKLNVCYCFTDCFDQQYWTAPLIEE
ncbi:MAG: clostripain-related cysteine peptidase [Lachnospiraceae bacterium]|jgi:hypothetical protein|nr:clostripain-related cysteine peptidase [Lachnospiraceae bacterium]